MKIGNIQRFCEIENKFKPHESLFVCPEKCNNRDNAALILKLKRGGTLEYFHSIMDESKREKVSKFMDECNIFRQYKIKGFNEPRVHVLLSSSAEQQQRTNTTPCSTQEDSPGPGYAYHGVKMKSKPLSQNNNINELASDLAKKCNISNNEWNIGVDLIIYRNGHDSIGWHADDTQGEDVILTVVVETDPRRTVMIRPKKKKNEKYQNGDEIVELIVEQGCAYKMDSKLQFKTF